ncbi:Transcription regulator HTH, LacI [Moorella glycerini]|uniref:HTH-type transcriptional regulator DegA n=1 Tax=Neomoorella stamsii TaxID=1266720 RepID=A0A9X7P743_9FIRM|nr:MULTISPECIES: LacI family DNA-binding transcriptional regulator [Moorella]PRR76094.1 HTH-type transcriptional regulator DegA [Moorella stamsii]CEP68300.1 Transcription regulator HTH, LacI [Moorella glycerini]
MEPTIKDVAKRARVSISTVSRVLSGNGRVTEETRQRVLRAVESLNYQPNLLAQSLKKRRSHTLGLVVQNIANPFFPDIVRGVEEKAQEYGYDVFLCDNRKDFQRGLAHLDVLQKRGVDGIIYSSMGRLIEPILAFKIMQLSEAGIPVVLLWRQPPGINIPMVYNDEKGGAYKATTHLISLGHRRIAFIGGFQDSLVTKERFEGYCLALEKNGLSFDQSLVTYSDFEVNGGREAARHLLTRDLPPTAIFTANDLMAIGVLMAAKQLNKKVPEDLAVVGFDGIPFTEYTDPPLTTVCVPRYEMGLIAVEKLLEQMGEKEDSSSDSIMLESHLVIRGSCGAVEGKVISGALS